MQPFVSIRDLNVSFGATSVLKNVNLDIPHGQITVILGPSGCGKSTLLRSLNRFLELSEEATISGKVFLDGEDIYAPEIDVTQIRARVGLLAQRPYPLPMSIYENVAYGIRILHLPTIRNLNVTVEHFLKLAGLWDEVKHRLHEPATSLSIGQQQRLCLARGLAVEPEVLLADEPTSALDPISAQHIETRLLDLKGRYTTILVTHILRQARRLADYVIFMYMGDVIEHGPVQQLFDDPQEEKTKAYLSGAIS